MNLAHTLPRSAVNGPGERFVLWVQGCPLACEGCWNPETWPFARRDLRDVDALAAEILATEGIEGVTFSGGEPFAQAAALAALATRLRAAGLSIFVFTGYEREELTHAAHRALLGVTDVLVTGRYRAEAREEGLVWRGSRNQQVHFLTERYDASALADAPVSEVYLDADGTVRMTGFPDAMWANERADGSPVG